MDISSYVETLRGFDKKLDRLLNDVDFIKNRLTTYVGNNEALTYLADETPIFVNTDDMGCPINFMVGGKYEQDYFDVLLSYRKSNSTILDIGANLGYYSIRLAPYVQRSGGKIFAFEPINSIRKLFERTIFMNSLDSVVKVYSFGLSDKEGFAKLGIPEGHTGGASLEAAPNTPGENIELRKLDNLFDENFKCDLIKMDVEGHELSALKGMYSILKRSEDCVVMFEKLASNSGIEIELMEFVKTLGWAIYSIKNTKITHVDLNKFIETGGYFLAGKQTVIEHQGFDRKFINIYPDDVIILSGSKNADNQIVKATNSIGEVLMYGPYWYLERGYYRLTFDGIIKGSFKLEIAEKFGFKVFSYVINESTSYIDFPIHRDLTKFEIVLKTEELGSELQFKKLQLVRLG